MTSEPYLPNRQPQEPSTLTTWILLAIVFLAVQFASLFTPPLLDDVDASHAQIAQHMAESGDLGHHESRRNPLSREAAASLLARRRLCIASSDKTSSPRTCPTPSPCSAAPGSHGSGHARAWGRRAGLYAALGVLTSIGPFLFTRFFIPEVDS